MATSPDIRELAHRLLTHDIAAGTQAEPAEATTLRVYEKLRRGLVELAGVAGFQSLAARALALARTEAPSLSAARIAADGSLQGLGEWEHGTEDDKDQAGEAGIVLVTRLLGLLVLFLGEALTLSLLRIMWPGEAFDDCIPGKGRTV